MLNEWNELEKLQEQAEAEDDKRREWEESGEAEYDDDEVQTCDCCGRDLNGYDYSDPCPFCCSSSYAPGSEECDWCSYSEECFKIYHKRGLA